MLQLIGWHGTTNLRQNNILVEGFNYQKYNPGKERQKHPNDLGNGCYFFLPFGRDSGKYIASAFVKKYKSKELKEKGAKPVLVNAELKFLSEELIFNLDEENNQKLLKEFRVQFSKELGHHLDKIEENGAKKRASRLNQNQGLLIELLLDLAKVHGKTYDAVQSTTYTDLKGFPVLNNKNGKEICVRNLKCIIKVK